MMGSSDLLLEGPLLSFAEAKPVLQIRDRSSEEAHVWLRVVLAAHRTRLLWRENETRWCCVHLLKRRESW